MNQMRLWASAGIIALIIVVGFALSVPHTHDVPKTAESTVVPSTPPVVALHDAFKKGVHTITGSLLAPNACTAVSANAALQGDASSTQTILVALSLPADTGVCLELPTRVNFSAAVDAPSHAPVTVTVNGVTASTTAS